MLRSMLSVLLVSVPLSAAISYPPPSFINTGLGPTAIATGDFNNDCAADFATANQFDASVTVRFGNGSGGFPTASTIPGFSSPQSIVSADFDNDSDPDLAVGGSPGLSILLNDGTGTFTAAASPATTGTVRWLASADLDEDGNADLLVTDGSFTPPQGVRLYLGDGTGGFAAPTALDTSIHTPGAMVAAELNGDANLDVAVVTGDSTAIFLGNGNGTFGAATFHLYPDPIVGADGAVHIAAADIDHDGDIDLATVAGNAPAGATVFNNNGSATFTRTKFQMPPNANPIFVALADLDGDTNLDIVSANQYGCTPHGSNLSARAGNGDGTFGASAPISIGYGPTCIDSHWQPNWIAPIDLNCDGAMDLVVANLNKDFASVLLTAGATDTTAPVITAPAAITVPSDASACSATIAEAALGIATATDNCSECVTITRSGIPAGNVFPAGTTTVTYTANDGHGNTSTATQNVTVTDGSIPAINAPADISVTAGLGCIANVDTGTPTASDACSSVTVTAVRSDAQSLGAPYPVGTTTIIWTATDTSGHSASDTQSITVTALPPVIGGASASPAVLWPPNHRLVDVTVSYSIAGGCGGATCAITAVTSNEPDNGLGDGDVANDWQIIDNHQVILRAERAGRGTGRVYTITITCSDSGGNTTAQDVVVNVPKSK